MLAGVVWSAEPGGGAGANAVRVAAGWGAGPNAIRVATGGGGCATASAERPAVSATATSHLTCSAAARRHVTSRARRPAIPPRSEYTFSIPRDRSSCVVARLRLPLAHTNRLLRSGSNGGWL